MGQIPLSVRVAITLMAMSIAVFAFAGQDTKGAVQLLQLDGWEVVEVGGFDWFGCNLADWYRTKFIGDRQGFRVNGTVCGSPWAGSYIRVKSW